MSFVDLDAVLLGFADKPQHEDVIVRLGGTDHIVVRPNAIEYMRMSAMAVAFEQDTYTAQDVREMAELLPRLLPTAVEDLEAIEDIVVLRAATKAVTDALDSPRIPVGVEAGEGCTVSEGQPSAPSPSSAQPTE